MAQDATIFSDKQLSDLKLSEWIIENCKTMGMERATNVQYETIPHILNGKDVVVRARTGSGKTAAFALPILEHLSQDPYGIFALILTPTRELACQIGDQFIALSANTGFTTAIAYGGSGYITNTGQIEDRPHILIATPGRLADLIKSGMEFDVSELKYLVIDEADQLLLNTNFNNDLLTIFSPLPKHKQRQTLLFSATLDKSMKQIFNVLKYNPNDKQDAERVVFIETSLHKLSTVQNIKQSYCFIPEMTKETYLMVLLSESRDIKINEKSVIIFVSSKEYCMIMSRLLKNFLLKVSELHGNMKQKKRLSELMRFRSGITNILVATDLASRGLDIPQVEYVINFDIPRNGFAYIHRIGRCGRVDRCGHAITFISQFDIKLLQNIEKNIKHKLVEFNLDKYQKIVLEKMERVLIIRAGIINSIETKFLLDPHGFKRDRTLRWNGKFTDKRILGKNDLIIENENEENKNVIEEHKELYNDYKNAYDNIFENIEYDNENMEQQRKEQMFLEELKEKEKKVNIVKKVKKCDVYGPPIDDMDDLDGNVTVMDEDVRINNVDRMNEMRGGKDIGKDFHELHGWQSFRFGKQGKKIKKLERMERAKKFQLKKKAMELKRSKREGRASELDLFSIYEKRDGRKVWKNKKSFKKKLKNVKKKKVKDKNVNVNDGIKISKSLRKKLSVAEQEVIKNKKRNWFNGGDIQWE